jgi:L-lactate dehydrogenase complex protein LldF
MRRPRVEAHARGLSDETVASVRAASAAKTAAREVALRAAFEDPEAARRKAAEIRDFALDHLRELLLQLEERCQANGIHVHWAADAEAANRAILEICRSAGARVVVKGKSMATEEIGLNDHLIGAGLEVVETDLGEFVVQLDGDHPSHIVTPIIHKNRREIADTFARHGLGPRTETPEELAMQARAHLRERFRAADVGVSGVNFAVTETGRLTIVENEGNNRFCTTAPDVHVAVMGIEKVLPREADLPLFLRLLAGSATGQALTSYVHLISGPRREDEPDGPREVHLILLDNGRTRVLAGPYREILRCIRCGACLNVCPVYRRAGGHAYGHVYSGPLGAVLAPALEGVGAYGDLAKASSLCGACEEVCPVRIPIPRMLLELRDEAVRTGALPPGVPWRRFAALAERGWRTGLRLLPMASRLPHPLARSWSEEREIPRREGREFRRWWQAHLGAGGLGGSQSGSPGSAGFSRPRRPEGSNVAA